MATMEPSSETAILFSALQLAESFLEGGLKSVDISDFFDENNSENLPLKTRHKGSADVIKVLSETINEIVNGVEYNLSKYEQDHWKFQVTTICLMLAMRETIVEAGEEELEILESFPDLSFDLALKLIAECDLEISLVDVLQNLDISMNLTIMSKMISHMNALIDSGVDKAEISAEFGDIFNSIIGYTFIHSNGILAKSLTSENLEETTEVIEKLIDLVTVMLSDSFCEISENENLSSTSNTSYPYAMAAFVGFLNYSCFLQHGSFAQMDILAIYMKEGDMVCWPNFSTEKPHENNTNRLLEVIRSYSFKVLDENELLLDMFESSTGKCVMTSSGHCPPKQSATFLKMLFNWLNNFCCENQVTNYLGNFLGYAKAVKNVKDAHKTKWGYSCSSRCLLLEIQKLILDKDKNKGKRLTPDKEVKSLDGNDERDIHGIFEYPVLKKALQTKHMNTKQLKEKNMFIVGERMEGYESAFTWLLDCVWFNISHIDSKWLICMIENMDLLSNRDNVQSLLNLSLKIQPRTIQEEENIKHVKDLFLNTFTKLPVCEQDEVLEFTYSKVDNPRDFFEIEQNNTKTQLTALLNRLTGSSFGISDNTLKEFTLLALQDPITVLDEVLMSVLRNQKHCDIMVGIMVKVPAVASFSVEGNEFDKVSYLSSSLNKAMQKVDNYTHKEVENLLNFIKLLLKPSCTDSGSVNLLDKQQFLLIYVLPILPTLALVEQPNENSIGRLALKVFIAVIQSLDDTTSWKEVNMINPVILMDCLCHYLDEVDHRINIANVAMFASIKSLLIKAINSLEDLMHRHVAELSQKEITWLYFRLNKLTNYYVIGYLMPLFWKFGAFENMQDLFVMHLPQCLYKFITIPKTSAHFKLMAVKSDGKTSSPCETLLKLCMVSDILCENITSLLKNDGSVLKRVECVAVLLKILPFALSEEWIRINSVLVCVNTCNLLVQDRSNYVKQSSFTEGNNEDSEWNHIEVSAQKNVQLMLLDSLLVLYDLDVVSGNPNVESVLLKGFTAVYAQKGLQCLRNAVFCNNKCKEFCPIEVIVANVCKLCFLFNKISLSMHDQVVGLLLEVIDCYNEGMESFTSSQGVNDEVMLPGKQSGDFNMETVLDTLPQHVKSVALKKLKCM